MRRVGRLILKKNSIFNHKKTQQRGVNKLIGGCGLPKYGKVSRESWPCMANGCMPVFIWGNTGLSQNSRLVAYYCMMQFF